MRISDWSSDVCSSDLLREVGQVAYVRQEGLPRDGSPTLGVNATYSPAIDTGVFCYSTHGVVVAVDPDTGYVEILDYAVVEDCGTSVDPLHADGQVEGGVAQGIGHARDAEIHKAKNERTKDME